MSFKSSLVKMAIKLAPDIIVMWVANIILKGIAELSAFSFDIDTRQVYVKATLAGEEEPIEVWIEGFAIESDEEAHRLTIHQGQSNRLWLNNLLARITGKSWKLPEIPQFRDQIELAAELFKPDSLEPEERQTSEQEDN